MKLLEAGVKAPEFEVLDQDGNPFSLASKLGKRVILFFYPKASTPGCTQEVCNLRDNYKELQDAGFELVGVSADSVKRQKNFATKKELPFPLLADEAHTVIDAYGVWGPKKMAGRAYEGIYRTTYVIDERGVIAHVVGKVKVKEHAAQILELYNL